MSFETLGLCPELLRAVSGQGYTRPTPIQSQAIPLVLAGRDILAGSQTGTGKTASFALPMLQKLSGKPAGHPAPRALVLTPTRELAAQVEESFRSYGKHLKLRSTVIFGGVGINPQKTALRRGVDILVATPGRLLDHAGQRTVDLSRVEMLVLDEGDRMLDMGFIHDIKRIMALLPKKRQNMLFSATYSSEIKALADRLLNSPALVETTVRNTAVAAISQKVYPVAASRKRELLSSLIRDGQWTQVLVFTRTKHGANKLTEQLLRDGVSAAAIHGNKSQAARTRALADFKTGQVRTLIATDIAARGLDIDQLPRVVNYELPHVPEDYVHRIGRTGRAGALGIALSLVSTDEKPRLSDIQKLLKQTLDVELLPEYQNETARSASAERPRSATARRPRFASDERPRAASSGRPRSAATRMPEKQPVVAAKRPARPTAARRGSSDRGLNPYSMR
ncbi:DEAD/DEAH box helicase [Desulfatiferula olefinivorans]